MTTNLHRPRVRPQPWPARTTVLVLLASLSLAGCAPTALFDHAPGPEAAVPVPAGLLGTWKLEERDRGQRLYVRPLPASDRVHVQFGQVPGEREEPPAPREARALDLPGGNWLLVGFGAEFGDIPAADQFGRNALVQWRFAGPAGSTDRICATVPATAPFLAAVARGDLAGETRGPGSRREVRVTSPASVWLPWWHAQADLATTGDELCMVRVGAAPRTPGAAP